MFVFLSITVRNIRYFTFHSFACRVVNAFVYNTHNSRFSELAQIKFLVRLVEAAIKKVRSTRASLIHCLLLKHKSKKTKKTPSGKPKKTLLLQQVLDALLPKGR